MNHRIEELMAIAASKTRTVKRQKNEIEALRIDLARRSTGSMPHDDLVDEIDRLNQAIAAYKVGEEPDPDLVKSRQHKTSGRPPRNARVSALSSKNDTKQSKWRKELNPQSLEGGNTWGMILDFCSFVDLGRMSTTCSQFKKHVESDNMSETWQDIAIALVERTFGAESVDDVVEIKNFEKNTTWKELCPRIRKCIFLGLPAEDAEEEDEEDMFIATTVIVDVGSTEVRIGADIHDYVSPLCVSCNSEDSYESKIEKAVNALMGSGMYLQHCKLWIIPAVSLDWRSHEEKIMWNLMQKYQCLGVGVAQAGVRRIIHAPFFNLTFRPQPKIDTTGTRTSSKW